MSYKISCKFSYKMSYKFLIHFLTKFLVINKQIQLKNELLFTDPQASNTASHYCCFKSRQQMPPGLAYTKAWVDWWKGHSCQSARRKADWRQKTTGWPWQELFSEVLCVSLRDLKQKINQHYLSKYIIKKNDFKLMKTDDQTKPTKSWTSLRLHTLNQSWRPIFSRMSLCCGSGCRQSQIIWQHSVQKKRDVWLLTFTLHRLSVKP